MSKSLGLAPGTVKPANRNQLFYRRNPLMVRSNEERPLPQSADAERSVLGAILLDDNSLSVVLPAVREILQPEDFFHSEHQHIYRSMIALDEAQQPVELGSVTDELHRSGNLEAVGGPAFVAQLIDGVPRISNFKFYAASVKEYSRRRALIHALHTIQQQALEGEDADTVLARASDSINALRLSSPTTWKNKFHTVEELPEGEPVMPIGGILPEGVTFLGANSGSGKTWLALAMARALIVAGRKFLGVWDVPEPVNVLYLCPEMNARTFKRRCKRFEIGGDCFRCMTISDGVALNLSDPLLLSAIRELHPVLFLDTAIRFSSADDENSSTQNAKGLGPAIFALIHAGARAVVCLHHRAKGASLSEELTLENCLRGTTDLGAVCDAVYGLQLDRGDGSPGYLRESKTKLRLFVRCVKARDFRAPDDFRVQLEPFLEKLHDMAVVSESDSDWVSDAERVDQAITANPRASLREIGNQSGVNKDRVKKLAAERGWHQDKADGWKQLPA